MKLLGLEGKGLLISVGITIIMCGAVTYYCHMRVKNVEVALMKQNQVLSSFITNVQGEIRKGGLSDTKIDVSSPEARNAVKNIENSKIEVSDDDDDSASASETDDDESDSASETDTEDETECEEDSENKNKIKVYNQIMKDMRFVDIHDNFVDTHIRINDFTTNSKIIELTDLEEITDFANLHDETDDDSDDESISDIESVKSEAKCDISVKKTETEFKKIILTEANVAVAEPLVQSLVAQSLVAQSLAQPLVEVVIKADVEADAESNDFIKKIVKTEDKEKEKTSNINKMKIDDLREKVILSGLGTVESVKKLKKSDLITLLTENK